MVCFSSDVKKLIILFFSILLCFINYSFNACIVQIISFWIFLTAVIVVMGGDFFHPYVWFLGAHILYSTAYPILYYMNIRTNRGYSSEPLFMSSLAILFFVLVVPAKRIEAQLLDKSHEAKKLNKSYLHILTIIITLSAFAIKILGYSNKKEIYGSSSFFTEVLSLVLIYINVFTLESCNMLSYENMIDKKTTIEIFIATFSITIFTGERDLFFRLSLIVILMLYFFGKIEKKSLILILCIFVILIPLSWKFKYFFLSGQLVDKSYDNGIKSVIENFLTGEFESASRNLQNLVNNKNISMGVMKGKTYISDITRIFGYAPYSAQRWHQNTFYATSSTGQGFTLVGEGYINFGYFGVIIEYIIVGLFIRVLYLNNNKNIYTLFIYISCIPIFIYANRADLSNVFSPFVRHVLLSAYIYNILKDRIKV